MADLKNFAEELLNLTKKEVYELARILKEEYGIVPAPQRIEDKPQKVKNTHVPIYSDRFYPRKSFIPKTMGKNPSHRHFPSVRKGRK